MSSSTVILVTGASRGLGLVTARTLASSLPASHIIFGFRTLSKDDTSPIDFSLPNTSKVQLDITDPLSVTSAVDSITHTHGKLDILINNAGISSHDPDTITNLSSCLTTNVIGSARVTEEFLPLLKLSSSPRLIFISTQLGSITARSDPNDPFTQIPAMGLRTSKAALNMVMACYGTQLKGEGFKVHGICPGFLATELNGRVEMMRKMGAREPEMGAELVLSVVKGERDEDVGRVVFEGGVRPW